MKGIFLITVFAAVMILAGTAQAKLVAKPACDTLKCRATSQAKNLAHAKYVCNNGSGRPRRWACIAQTWLARELAKTQQKIRYSMLPSPSTWPWPIVGNCETGGINGGVPKWSHETRDFTGAYGFRRSTWTGYAPDALARYGIKAPGTASKATPAMQTAVAIYVRDHAAGGTYSPWPECRALHNLP